MTLNNGSYYLNNMIDCTGLGTFSTYLGYFGGTLDGRGNTILNLTAIGPIFNEGQNAIFKNITFLNFNMAICSSCTGLIVGRCDNCTIDGIILNTTDTSIANVIDTLSIVLTDIGGLAGYAEDSIISNCIIQNTFINIPGGMNVGGIVGLANRTSIVNCHNVGFPSNVSQTIIYGGQSVGGLVGQATGTEQNNVILNSGVSNGEVFGDDFNIGGVVGTAYIVNFNATYSKSSVIVTGLGATNVGGIVGNYFSNSSSMRAVYSKASISGYNVTGGIIGVLSANINTIVEFCFFTGTITSTLNGGGIAGFIVPSCVIFAETSTINTVIRYNGQNTFDANPMVITCGEIYERVLLFYNNYFNIWWGDNLIFEYPSTYGFCNCTNCPTFSPSTITPSTLTPSTVTPSTITPSTQTPSTLIPSTLIPSSLIPTTSEPSSLTPSSLVPSSSFPSTLEPSTSFPSTLVPSTNNPSTMVPTTTISTTTTPSTISPVNCLYNVPNCLNCGIQGLSVDKSQYNISCILNGNKWAYLYTPLFSNTTITVSQSFTLNGTGLIIEGNINISSTVNLVIVISNLNSLNKDIGAINITGCVNFDGNITMDLSERPQSGNITIVLIRYNCANNTQSTKRDLRDIQTFQTSQFAVKPTYKNNKCDKIESTINNQQGTLSVVLSTTQNSKCGGISTGAIIGIVLGVVGFTVLVISIGAFYIWKRNSDFDKRFTVNMNELEKMDKNKMKN